jgi:hypothetical protein
LPGELSDNAVAKIGFVAGFDDRSEFLSGFANFDSRLGVTIHGSVDDVGPIDQFGKLGAVEPKPFPSDGCQELCA